ncbi:gastrin-releasing peptide isoform X2 [Neoarius graeffei]|uniref:gastrin-releasing peptide isoform X2 n=1 Tax=Neoarius graeffei TaxID=443677 RepID=UPI00298CD571|nr:gastrin-releasing peptide isoform X2 [Neoarius graeffei]
MCVLWRYRLTAMSVLSVLMFFLGCEAQLHNEAQSGKLVYARGNHWAVGHLMGKKSIDETLDSDDPDVNAQAYLITAESDTHTKPSRLLKALIKALAGPERETEDKMERQELLMELRRQWEEQLAERFLLLALNTRDADAS